MSYTGLQLAPMCVKGEDAHGSGLLCRMCRLRAVKDLQHQVQHIKIIVLKLIKFA